MDLAQYAAATVGIADDAEIKEKLGGFNDFPPNFEVIHQSHFLWLWNVSAANRRYIYRQAYRGPKEPRRLDDMQELHFWVFPDFSGIGWITHYDYRGDPKITSYTCTYFRFAVCVHEYEVKNARMCYREYHCKTCGYIEIVDSSD